MSMNMNLEHCSPHVAKSLCLKLDFALVAVGRVVRIGGIAGLITLSSGCFSAWVSPTQHIAPPATKIAPTALAEPSLTESASPAPYPTSSRTSSMEQGLLTPPLPQDLPHIPFSKE